MNGGDRKSQKRKYRKQRWAKEQTKLNNQTRTDREYRELDISDYEGPMVPSVIKVSSSYDISKLNDKSNGNQSFDESIIQSELYTEILHIINNNKNDSDKIKAIRKLLQQPDTSFSFIMPDSDSSTSV